MKIRHILCAAATIMALSTLTAVSVYAEPQDTSGSMTDEVTSETFYAETNSTVYEAMIGKWIAEWDNQSHSGTGCWTNGIYSVDNNKDYLIGMTLGEIREKYSTLAFPKIEITSVRSATGITADMLQQGVTLSFGDRMQSMITNSYPVDDLIKLYGEDAVLTAADWYCSVKEEYYGTDAYTAMANGEYFYVTLGCYEPYDPYVTVTTKADKTEFIKTADGGNTFYTAPGSVDVCNIQGYSLANNSLYYLADKFASVQPPDLGIILIENSDIAPSDIILKQQLAVYFTDSDEPVIFAEGMSWAEFFEFCGRDRTIKSFGAAITLDNTNEAYRNIADGETLVFRTTTENRRGLDIVLKESTTEVVARKFVDDYDSDIRVVGSDIVDLIDDNGNSVIGMTVGELAENYNRIDFTDIPFSVISRTGITADEISQGYRITLSNSQDSVTFDDGIDRIVELYGADSVIEAVGWNCRITGTNKETEAYKNMQENELLTIVFNKDSREVAYATVSEHAYELDGTYNGNDVCFSQPSYFICAKDSEGNRLDGMTIGEIAEKYKRIEFTSIPFTDIVSPNGKMELSYIDQKLGAHIMTPTGENDYTYNYHWDEISVYTDDLLEKYGANSTLAHFMPLLSIPEKYHLTDAYYSLKSGDTIKLIYREDTRDTLIVDISGTDEVVLNGTSNVWAPITDLDVKVDGITLGETTCGELIRKYKYIEFADYSIRDLEGTITSPKNFWFDHWICFDNGISSGTYTMSPDEFIRIDTSGLSTSIEDDAVITGFGVTVPNNLVNPYSGEKTDAANVLNNGGTITVKFGEDTRAVGTYTYNNVLYGGEFVFTDNGTSTGASANIKNAFSIEGVTPGVTTFGELAEMYKSIKDINVRFVGFSDGLELTQYGNMFAFMTMDWQWIGSENGEFDTDKLVEKYGADAVIRDIIYVGWVYGSDLDLLNEKFDNGDTFFAYLKEGNRSTLEIKRINKFLSDKLINDEGVFSFWDFHYIEELNRLGIYTIRDLLDTYEYISFSDYEIYKTNLDGIDNGRFILAPYLGTENEGYINMHYSEGVPLSADNSYSVTYSIDKMLGNDLGLLHIDDDINGFGVALYLPLEDDEIEVLEAQEHKLVFFEEVDFAVENLMADVDGLTVKLSWDGIYNAEKYRVQQLKSGKWSTIDYPKETTYTIDNLTSGTEYSFRVIAYVYGEWRAASEAVTVTPTGNIIPQNLTAKATSGSVALSWDAVPSTVKYRVQVKNGSSWSTLSYPTGTSFTATGLTNGTAYTFRVLAYVNGVWSKPSETVSATPIGDTTPQNLTVKAGNGYAVLSWNKVSGATKYRIQMNSGSGWSTVAYPTTNSYTAENLKNGITYSFRVLAYAGGSWSKASATVKAVPVGNIIPQNLKVKSGNGTVTLTWDNVDGAVKYRVQHYVSGKWATIAYPKSNSCTVTGLKNGGKYVYRVLSYVNGAWSGASAKVLAVPSAAPQNVKATAGNGCVTITWNEVEGAVKYRVQHYVAGSWTTASYPKENTVTLTGLKNGGKYVYRVLAYSDGSWGPASEKVLVIPRA